MYHSASLAAHLLLSTAAATAPSLFSKRDSWGPAFSLGPAKAEIISTSTTIYPGAMPAAQAGYLFVWLGISNGTGDLIQSIIGSYPKGQSECSGPNADTAWCISSEVYGLADNGYPNQWVGALTTADTNYANGINLNYTLVDKSSYLWQQTMSDAVTGALLSSFNKTSGPMLGWGTAIECNDYNGVACTGTVSEQSYVNSTIVLESADSTFVQTLGAGSGVTHSEMVTADGGKTWTIGRISIPAMQSGEAAVAVSSAAAVAAAVPSTSVEANVDVASSTSADVEPVATLSIPTFEPSSVATSFAVVPTATSRASGAAQPSGGFGSFTTVSGSVRPTGSFGSGSARPSGSWGSWGQFTAGPGAARPSGSFGRHRGGKWGGFGRRA